MNCPCFQKEPCSIHTRNVYDFAADYYDMWIVPVQEQYRQATGERRKRLKADIERLLKDREAAIVATYGRLP